jgi:hypothetical protein
MLVIRDEQMAMFRQIALRRFEDRLFERLRETRPQLLAAHGEAALRGLIRQGRERAQGYGISKRHDIERYIDLMLELGADFDRDGAHPWARELLEYPNVAATVRLDWLCERAAREAAKARLRARRPHG